MGPGLAGSYKVFEMRNECRNFFGLCGVSGLKFSSQELFFGEQDTFIAYPLEKK
jgi:hypothetical protein